MHQFCKNSQALRVINSVCASVAKGNCRGRKQPIVLKENKPLPKRRRIRKAPCTEKKEKADDNHFTLLQPDDYHSYLLPPFDDHSANHSDSDDNHSASDDNHSDLDDNHSDSDDNINHSDSDDKYSASDDNYSDSDDNHSDSDDNHSDLDGNHSDSDDNHSDLQPLDDNLMQIENETIYLDDCNIDVVPAHLNDEQLLIPKFSDAGNDTVQEHAVRKALGPGRADEVMSRGYGIVMRRQDIWTLNDCGWLNDQVHTCNAHECCLILIHYYPGDQLLYGSFNGEF